MEDERAAGKHFFVTGGTVSIDAPSYVERKADRELFEALSEQQFCYVLTSRQMGKSSLMVRTVKKLREQRITVVALDLTAIGQNLTPDQWYDGLCLRIGEQLRMEDELEDFWHDNQNLGPAQRLFTALREVVLSRVKRLVVFVDELDVVLSLPFSTDEFFAAIRECFNRRTMDPAFANMTFCLMGVATPSDLIKDTRMTPFNIGRRIELTDFTEPEAMFLAIGLQDAGIRPKVARALLQRILHWTGGHPYLTQRLCLAVVEGRLSQSAGSAQAIDTGCENLFFSNRARERDDNLIFVRERLLRSEVDLAGLLHLYDNVLRGRQVRDDEMDPLVSVLRLSGVACEEHERLVPRNRIYARAFDHAWVRAHLPDAEVRRQRAAFYRGVVRATALGTAIASILVYVAWIAVREAANARLASAHAYYSQAQATRLTARIGQRADSLQALHAARSHFTNEFLLRDEVVSSLSLMDLQETTQRYAFPSNAVSDIHLNGGVTASGHPNGSVTLRGLQGGDVLKTLPGDGRRVSRLRFSPTHPYLAAGYTGPSGTNIVIWDWPSGQPLCSLPESLDGAAMDFGADGKRMALGLARGAVVVYSIPEGEKCNEIELKLRTGRPRVPHSVRFNPSTTLLAESSLDDPLVQVWDLQSDLPSSKPFLSLYHRAEVYDIAWHPRGELLATACGDFSVYLWSTNRANQSMKLSGHEALVSAVAFNHRGTMIASLGEDETVRLWMPSTDLKMSGPMVGGGLDELRFDGDDRMLVATGASGTKPMVWKVMGGEFLELHVHVGTVDAWRSLDFSADGRIVAALNSQRAMLWNTDSGLELGVVDFINAESAWFSADGRSLWGSSNDGLFRGRWTGEAEDRALPGRRSTIQQVESDLTELGAMALTRDRGLAAIVHLEELLVVPLTTNSMTSIATRRVGAHYQHVALHPEAKWLAGMVPGSNVAQLWRLDPPQSETSPIELPSGGSFVFSPDGQWFVTSEDAQFLFYRVGDWDRPAFQIVRRTISDQFAPIAFTQDGSLVALASSRYVIELYQWTAPHDAAPQFIAALDAPVRSPLEMLAFSPDGRRLAAATQERTLQLWNLQAIGAGLAEFNLSDYWPSFPKTDHEARLMNGP